MSWCNIVVMLLDDVTNKHTYIRDGVTNDIHRLILNLIFTKDDMTFMLNLAATECQGISSSLNVM